MDLPFCLWVGSQKSHWSDSCTWSLNLFLLGLLRLLNLGYVLTSSLVIFCLTFSGHTGSFALPWGTQSLLRVLVFCLKPSSPRFLNGSLLSSHRQTLLKCHLHREIFPDFGVSNSSPSILLLSSPHPHFIFIFHPHYLFFLVIRYTYHNLKKNYMCFLFSSLECKFYKTRVSVLFSILSTLHTCISGYPSDIC